ncbi:hypothetical protein JCM21900_006378 [Sporobolomyces salmonicolor]
MQHLFTGAANRKPTVNLGGARRTDLSATTQQDLINRARQEREQRENDRKRSNAARIIQAFYRGRRSAAAVRQQLRAEFDSILSAAAPSPSSVILASRLLALFFVDRHTGDIKRTALWCRVVLRPAGAQDKTPLLFSLFSDPSWAVLARQAGTILFTQATSQPSLPQSALFLEISKIMCDPQSYVKYRVGEVRGPTLLKHLLHERKFYARLGGLISSIPTDNRSHPLLPAAITLSLLPFKAHLAPPPPASKSAPQSPASPERSAALTSFATSILPIPLLPNRLAVKEFTMLATLPFFDILLELASPSGRAVLQQLEPESAVHVLANLIALGNQRLSSIENGKKLAAYLVVAKALMDKLPNDVFREEKPVDDKGKGKADETIVLDDSELESEGEMDGDAIQRARAAVGTVARDSAGDVVMGSTEPSPSALSRPSRLSLDPRTHSHLRVLSSRAHLLALLALSTRFSASTRLPLAAFLITLLALLPPSSSQRDSVLNTLLYAPSASGLLRELYRGYVRSGSLGKLLARAGREKSNVVMSALADPQFAEEWPVVVLVLEMYSRCLLTLGDDEFYTTSPGREAEGRNPLMLEEVVGLSGMVRNAAFAMYWQEGAVEGGAAEGVDEAMRRKVVGTRVAYEEVRALMTRFLQQVHARDSRRQFTPEGHWLMTSQFDLASFVQTAVHEDERLQAEGAVPSSTPTGVTPRPHAGDDDDIDGDNESVRRPYRRPGPVRSHRNQHGVLSKRQMALISPRLGVLNNIPFVISFETRVAIFRQFIENDFRKLGLEDPNTGFAMPRARHRAVVRRNHLAEDAYTHLNGLGAELKKRIAIVFVDEHGMEESGIDGGGLFKELLTSLSKEVFDTDRGLWLATKEQEIYPNPHGYAKESTQLSWYQFIGRVLGKALYQGILIDVRFAAFFLAKWLGRQSYLDDLASLDPELYAGLIKLKNYPGNVEEDLSLNFTVTDDDFGVSRTIDLIPNGSEIAVTNENRMQYIVLVSNYRLNVQIAPQCRAFLQGVLELVPERFLRMFNAPELAILIGGVDEPIDVSDLRRNTVYGGWDGDENNPTITAFWSTVESFGKDDRAKLVKFVTSCARPPLLGFKELNPLFAIRNAGSDENRLPTSATCVNLLKLPEYKDPASLREKLLYAINSGAGFDLS